MPSQQTLRKLLNFTLILAAPFLLAPEANAQSEMCVINSAIDQKVIIEACTRKIQSGKLTGSELGYAYAIRARASRWSNSFDEAISDATTAIKLNPSYGLSYYVRAQAYSGKKRYDEAIRDYNSSLNIRPNDANVFQELGHVYQAKGDFYQADENYSHALRSNPRFSWAHNDKCWIRGVFNRELQIGLQECNEALRHDPSFEPAYNSRGLIQLRLQNYSAAISDYTTSIKLCPNKASSFYGRGYAELKSGDKENGNKDISTGKSIQPNIDSEFESYGLQRFDSKSTPISGLETRGDHTPFAPTVPLKRPRKTKLEVSPM